MNRTLAFAVLFVATSCAPPSELDTATANALAEEKCGNDHNGNGGNACTESGSGGGGGSCPDTYWYFDNDGDSLWGEKAGPSCESPDPSRTGSFYPYYPWYINYYSDPTAEAMENDCNDWDPNNLCT
jgi:hypothetical protein